jgi:hypothetical protein
MLMDDFLPMYEEAKRYTIIIRASPETVYSVLKNSDINESWIIRFLFLIRGLPALFSRHRRSGRKTLTIEDITVSGFLPLADKRHEEIVLGVVGQFWRPSGNICKSVSSETFVGFNEPGFGKAVWNFSVKESGIGCSELSTETRIHCIGERSQKQFKHYWRVIGPFSGIIRKEILKIVKHNAENHSVKS